MRVFKNVTVGSGKAVHLAYEEDGLWLMCGSDHATNRGMVSKRVTAKEVTCKKCLKRGVEK